MALQRFGTNKMFVVDNGLPGVVLQRLLDYGSSHNR
jgi:hypothetical protein